MSAVDKLFAKLKADGKKAFMPFITAGDPDLKTTSEIMQSLDSVGCHICELGIPSVSYTHLRAHETGRNLVCRLLLEKKK